MTAGFFIGYHDDRVNNNKTPGEAIAHNSASLGVGLATNAAGTAVVGLFLTSNFAGWAVLGGIVIGTVLTTVFNYAYKTNKLGIQDRLDFIGERCIWKKCSRNF